MMPQLRLPSVPSKLLAGDGRLLLATRCGRMFAYGALAVVLVLYLESVRLTGEQIGSLLTLTLLGDTAVSLWLTTRADRFGRRRTLIIGAVLMAAAGVIFAITDSFVLLLAAATVGVISPSGSEVGPFLSVEQAALAETVSDSERTEIFAWYNLAGSVATALGALVGGWLCFAGSSMGMSGAAAYQPVIVLYALTGVVIGTLFWFVSPGAEVRREHVPAARSLFGLHKSRSIVLMLAALFALDAFGGGFVLQSLLAAWLNARFGADPRRLGEIFFAANLFAAGSSLAAAALARRFGLLNTMVFTHLPSNILLILVPFMPNLPLAVALLLARFSISQMDVPTRQSFTMAVVRPDERSAAAGLTAVARSIGASISPYLASLLIAQAATASLPLILAGGIKIAYDVWLYWAFTHVQPSADDTPAT